MNINLSPSLSFLVWSVSLVASSMGFCGTLYLAGSIAKDIKNQQLVLYCICGLCFLVSAAYYLGNVKVGIASFQDESMVVSDPMNARLYWYSIFAQAAALFYISISIEDMYQGDQTA